MRFLKSKLAEYEAIKAELEELQKDATGARYTGAVTRRSQSGTGSKGDR